jgi:hypothetical protein
LILEQIARSRRTAEVEKKFVSLHAMRGHPTLTDEAASIIHSESNEASGAIVLPGCQWIHLLSHGTASDDASELNHAVAWVNVQSLLSAVFELKRHAGIVRCKVGYTDAEFAPLNHGRASAATMLAQARQIRKGRLANPRQGFCLILRPEDQLAGAPDPSAGSIP